VKYILQKSTRELYTEAIHTAINIHHPARLESRLRIVEGYTLFPSLPFDYYLALSRFLR
jgi:hypothetical protein